MKTSKGILKIIPIQCIPLFAGPLFLRVPNEASSLVSFLTVFFSLLCLQVLWLMLSTNFENLLPASRHGSSSKHQKPTPKEALRGERAGLLVLVLLTLLCVLSLHYLKLKLSPQAFSILLAALGARALTIAALRRNYLGVALVCMLGSASLLAFLSFELGIFAWEWQAGLVALGFGCMATCFEYGRLIAQVHDTGRQDLLPHPWVTQLFGICLFLGPSCIVLLSFLGRISQWYTLCYLLLPFCARLLREARGFQDAARFNAECTGIYFLFVAMILAASLLS